MLIVDAMGENDISNAFVGEYWKNDMYDHPHIREIIWEFQMWANKNFAGC